MANRYEWVNCPKCGHRLFKWYGGDTRIEVKCPSCKRIMELIVSRETILDSEGRKNEG